jgi:hypothetical protein
VTVVIASVPLAGVHRAVDAWLGSAPVEASRGIFLSFMVGTVQSLVTYYS